MEFVKGTINDLEEIVSLNFTIFEGMYETPPFSLNDYKEKLKDKKPIIFLAKENGVLVGNSVSFGRDENFYIWILGTSKDYRKKGIGNELFKLNEDYAKKNNFVAVAVKVYGVSKEMLQLASKRGFIYDKVEKSQNPRQSIFYLKLLFSKTL